MIKLNSSFFFTVDALYNELNVNKTKEQIFNECVEERLGAVLRVQGEYFDRELQNLENTLNWDFSEINNIKNVANVLKKLYKVIACDRISILESLIITCEVQ